MTSKPRPKGLVQAEVLRAPNARSADHGPLFLPNEDCFCIEVDVTHKRPKHLTAAGPGEGCETDHRIDPRKGGTLLDEVQQLLNFIDLKKEAVPQLRDLVLKKAPAFNTSADLWSRLKRRFFFGFQQPHLTKLAEIDPENGRRLSPSSTRFEG